MFMIFVFLLQRLFQTGLLPTLGTAVFMGIFLESIQAVVPGRYPGLGDMLLNIAGAILGILFISHRPTRTHMDKN